MSEPQKLPKYSEILNIKQAVLIIKNQLIVLFYLCNILTVFKTLSSSIISLYFYYKTVSEAEFYTEAKRCSET